MAARNIEIELERCAAEQEWILNRADVMAGEVPAWLVTLGLEDWEMEKRLILAEGGYFFDAFRLRLGIGPPEPLLVGREQVDVKTQADGG